MSQSLQLLGSNRSAILSTSSWYLVCAVQYFRVFKTKQKSLKPNFQISCLHVAEAHSCLVIMIMQGKQAGKSYWFSDCQVSNSFNLFFQLRIPKWLLTSWEGESTLFLRLFWGCRGDPWEAPDLCWALRGLAGPLASRSAAVSSTIIVTLVSHGPISPLSAKRGFCNKTKLN